MTSYQYDVLNRLIRESRADGNIITYTYDTGSYGIGRLTGMSDPSGTTFWAYDIQGRVIQKTQVTGGISLGTAYAYDTIGQLTSITYPSGETVNYAWDNGKVTSVSRGTTVIASGITYHPFGPVKSWAFGNGQSLVRTFDLDGRITAHTLAPLGYDAASRITGITPGGMSVLGSNKTYGYDAMDRLTSFSDGTSTLTYTYDATGNRIAQTINGMGYTYSVRPSSNRLDTISGPGEFLTYSHNANGSVTGNGQKSFTYDAGGRLTDVAGLASYSLNGLGQRVRKSASGLITLFVFDEGGRLVGEYDGSGNPLQETVWLGDVPLAVLKAAGTYYIHTDHLNTPRQIHDAIGQAVWAWDAGTFGTNPPNENLAGSGTFTYNLRYPGQYYDSETGLHYNYFRDYDPKTGRYIQSDPIGLAGGINTYGYVGGNPLRYTDPRGTNPVAAAIKGAEIGTAILPRAGTVVGGLAGAGIGWWIANKVGNISFAKPRPGSKPKGCPAGTMPIDQIPGLDKDDVHGIKDGVGAGPRDWTGIAPNGDVITGDSNGNAVNHGPYSDYLP